jgi:hypothetical protein
MEQRGHLNLMKPGKTTTIEMLKTRTERTFKFNETLRHIPAGEELIDRVYNVFKMICPDIIFLAKIYRI